MNTFTLNEYRSLLQLALKRYTFAGFDECDLPAPEMPDRIVFWRHDIDLSLENAVQLAQIEAEEGATSTYFVHLHSAFYHPWERRSFDRLQRIVSLGHSIGLHFDTAFYGSDDLRAILPWIKREADFLGELVGRPIRVFSAHNPTEHVLATWTEDSLLGMVNTYARFFRDHVDYVSDSNGIWRHRSLKDALLHAEKSLLQVLTHPVWWSEKAASPEQKMREAIARRSEETESSYRQEARLVVSKTPEPDQLRKAG